MSRNVTLARIWTIFHVQILVFPSIHASNEPHFSLGRHEKIPHYKHKVCVIKAQARSVIHQRQSQLKKSIITTNWNKYATKQKES